MATNKTEDLLSHRAEELEKRRQAVDATINSHEIEGITLHPKTLEILEQYARGDLSLKEFNTLMDNAIL
ncbi:antitoxin VbhA family protein [Bartonella harrusi]|uniref:Antitoxin VbhA family protein n=1 Tax=Bartonella harrusi TaxID=2961895 RepID=A0ABY5EVR2_9HYPH|nr:antitoxin VbhA family protein [Bartonella harrusi]UTO28070.1 antitoxin VbhA family protein [Bartonella harrusi]